MIVLQVTNLMGQVWIQTQIRCRRTVLSPEPTQFEVTPGDLSSSRQERMVVSLCSLLTQHYGLSWPQIVISRL